MHKRPAVEVNVLTCGTCSFFYVLSRFPVPHSRGRERERAVNTFSRTDLIYIHCNNCN